jgi:hypothetical protein
MSFTFSRALVEEFSRATCSAADAFAPLSTTPTPDQFWWPDKTTEHSRLSRFGMTCEPLTVAPGDTVLTWWLEASRARTSASPATGTGSTARDRACGPSSCGSFAKFNRDELRWKTHQLSLAGDLEEFSETWPRWGSMRNGECWERAMLAPRISESGSGLWQTPVADDAVERKAGKWNSRGEPKLSAQVLMVPTPCARDYRGVGRSRMERTGSKAGENLPQFLGGLLNPDWTEWLMGWPIGWTELKPLATAKFREWRQQHGTSWAATERKAA